MTETFEDRLFEAVIDEVRHPSLPRFEEASGPARSMPDGERRRRRWVAAAAVAAGVALLAGGVVVLSGDDGVPVRTSDAAAPVDGPAYLTFGDPVGEVRRNSVVTDTRPTFTYRPVADPAWRIDIAAGPAVDLVDFLSIVGVVGDRTLRSLTPAEAGGKPFGVSFWTEADGSTWSISATNAALGEIDGDESTELGDVVDAFLGQLDYADGEFTPSAAYEAFVPLDRAPRAWVISDDRALLAAIEDSTTDVGALPGERTTVRGKAAVFGDGVLRWRESSDRILELGLTFDRARSELDQRSLPIEQRDPVIVDPPTLPELQRVADGLVESDQATYGRLRLLRGARIERVVLMPPTGSDQIVVNVESAGSPTDRGGTMTTVVGSDGWAIDPVSTWPDATGYWIWSAGTSVTTGGERPACARYVEVPPDGEPAVTVVVDPACTG